MPPAASLPLGTTPRHAARHACTRPSCAGRPGVQVSVAPRDEGRLDAAPPSSSAPPSRRATLAGLAAAAAGLLLSPSASAFQTSTLPVFPAVVTPSTAPDPAAWDPADRRLRAAANALQSALNAETLAAEEAGWSAVIDEYSPLLGDPDAPWAADIVARALGNRGNARARAGRMDDALADLNASIRLAPYSVDPLLNRGVVLEQSGRLEEAAADYRAVLAAAPADPSAWNNLGNTLGLLGSWSEAEQCFAKAASLAPSFSFAAANRAAVLFQLGRDGEAARELTRLLRRFPSFDDARAALAAVLWARGDRAEAEDQWLRVADPRYRDKAWLARDRHWPPRLVAAAAALLEIK